ncbi:hypothetical protein [Chromobacterium sphagni]|uniref:hypothetical protein n=1 Tax=Chromobacterium sphagni TaxID=1903179 RepID=UPI001113FA0B|nr:hypothetical protein [Chromobacterium sphagni]
MALALDEIASPSSLFSFHLPAGDTALKIEQVSGPALLSVHPQSGSKVNLITGPDSGKQEIVRLRIQGRQRQYLASFGQLTLIGQSHDSMLEPDEGGKMDDLSDLAVLPSATTLGTTLSDQAGPQTIALRSPSNRRLSSLLATLDNGKDAFDLGEHIALQGNGQITLHTAKLKPLLLPGRLHELFLSGWDSQGLGLVIVASAQENVTEQQEKEVSIPVGVNKINIQAIVHTNEYPDYSSSPGNQFNNSWRYWWTCAGQQYHQAGQVNNSHSNRTVRQFSHNLSLDPKRTAPALCRIGAAAVNIGDSIVTTSVHVQIQGERFSIDKFEYKNGLWLDDSRGGNQHYNMSLPTQLGPQFGIKRPWAMEITYSPADTPIRKVGLDLRYDGKRLPLTKDASFSLSRPGLLKVSYAATQPLPLQPVAGLAQLEAVLYSDTDGVEHSTQPQAMAFPLTRKDAFQPLFEIRNVLNLPENRRYGPRDDATGGDGWLRNDMLNLLGAPPILPLLGDISGEHGWQDAAGKAMGAHSTHKGGYDADLRYWDENGRWDGPMRGDSNGEEIARVVQAARAEVKNGAPAQPNLNRLVNWVRWNRSQLSALESRLGPQLRKIYVGDTIWFARPLLEGRFPDSVDIPLPGANTPNNILGPWPNKSAKIVPTANHNHHFHIRLVP